MPQGFQALYAGHMIS